MAPSAASASMPFLKPFCLAGDDGLTDAKCAGECAQMLFRGIGRAKAELGGDFRASRWHAGFGHGALDETEDLGLAGCEV